MPKKNLIGLTLMLLFALVSAVAQAESGQQAAVWKIQKENFFYQGFTTRYSCDGLRDKVRKVLIALGARADSGVAVYGCLSSFGRTTGVPSLTISVATLQPARQAQGTVPAVWKKLNLGGSDTLDAGDCELAEQIKRKILPLFAVRHVRMLTMCVPHQPVTGPISLELEVLSAAPAGR